ncbi:MAG: hypothetical protein WDW38_004991 [Sanguina aurantia]
MRDSGTYKLERVITSAQGASVGVSGRSSDALNFCANNYLGLSNHPALAEAAIDAIRTHGYGLSSVRFICGTQDPRQRLEACVPAFHSTQLSSHVSHAAAHDCHATGFVGASGRGSDEHCGVHGQVDIINSTLGKALGGATGGYTTGKQEVIDMLRQRSRPYLFSNTLAPAVVGASLAALNIITASPALRDTLEANTLYFRQRMTEIGFQIRPGDVAGHRTPRAHSPIMLGDAALASSMAAQLLAHDVYVTAFSYPVVPRGRARIRVQISAAHTRTQIDAAVAAFQSVGRELGVVA